MTMHRFAPRHARTAVVALAAAGVVVTAAEARVAAQQAPQRSRIAFSRDLPAMDGAHLNMKVVDVRLGPGESSPPHRHNCAVVVYVVDGVVHMQVRGGPDSTYRRGETFFESPTDIHQVSANASRTDSAHFTATFTCDHAGPLTTPVP
jgi:quercetin dioxygenase-like cupin family protein